MLFSQLSISGGPLNAVRYVNIVTASVGRCEMEKKHILTEESLALLIRNIIIKCCKISKNNI